MGDHQRWPQVVWIVAVVLTVSGCELSVPSPEADDQLVGVIGISSDTPILPPGETGLPGRMLLAPAEHRDELLAGTTAQERLERRRGRLAESARHFRMPVEQIRETNGTRIVPIEDARFVFDGVESGPVVLCHIKDAPEPPPGLVDIGGCVELDVDVPMRIKLLSRQGTLGVSIEES